MPMAADQRKRRLSSSTTAFGYGFQEQNRAKKRDLRLPNYDFNFNTHVSLIWDDNGKRVVAKEDQIGISWRHLSPFIASAPCSKTKLADVVTVPRDVFELNDMSEALSYEVWQSVLTEKERNFLTQFLPYGVEANEVVHALCSGDNFHFGNPLFKWGSSVCSGDVHPDAVLQHEKSFKANKRAYYLELQQYHDNMIRNLQNLKQTCAGSKDPEAEIQQIIARSKRHEKTIVADANGEKYHKPDDNIASMSESLSPVADDRLCSSDNQKLSAIRDTKMKKRMHNQDFMKDKHEKSLIPRNGVKVLPKLKKEEKLQKPIPTPHDGAKYMSFVKISKKQHELVKSLRQSGSSIQSRALNRLLGGLDSSNVKPFEMFVEEEQKRIHEHWSNLANKDIPAAFQSWRSLQLTKRKCVDSLWKEMEEKLRDQSKDVNLINDYNEEPTRARDEDDGERSHGTSEGHQDDDKSTQDSSSDNGEEESDPGSSKTESPMENPPLNINEVIGPSYSTQTPALQNPTLNVNEGFDPSSPMETQSNVNNEEFDPSSSMETQAFLSPLNVKQQFNMSMSLENQSLHHPAINVKEELESIQHPLNVNESFDLSSMENKSSMEDKSPLSRDEDYTPMDLNAENNPVTSEASDTFTLPEQHAAQTSEAPLTISHSSAYTSATGPNTSEIPGSSLKNMWSSIGLPESYHSHPTTLHPNSSGLCLRDPQIVTDQPAQLIDLESDMSEEHSTKDLLTRHASHSPFFNPYAPNRDGSELLHSVIKHDNFHQQQKKPGEFHPTNVLLEPANQFPAHFQEHLQQPPFTLDNQQQKTQGELFMHQNIHDDIYTDKNRYSVQGPEHFPSLNVRDWSNARLSNPIQPSQLNSGQLLNHNWFTTNENRAHGGWSSSDSTLFPAQSLASGSNSSDQSLYSVFTQCNMHSRAPFSPVGSTEQTIPPANYGQEMVGGIPMASNVLPPPVSPFDYLSGGEASTTLKNPDLGWMNVGNQPSGLQDPSGKPFLKSWNQ